MSTNLRAAIVAILKGHAGTSALVGDRVYPFPGPLTAVRPFVTYGVLTNVRDRHNRGPNGKAKATVQLDAFADTLDLAAQICDQVAAALDGYAGSGTGCHIYIVNQEDERDLLEFEDDGTDDPVARITMTYEVSYKNS